MSKAADLNRLVEGVELYEAFPFCKDSLLLSIGIINVV
jgi:hypothetical protein